MSFKVELPIIESTDCNKLKNPRKGGITEFMVCAGDLRRGGKDTCAVSAYEQTQFMIDQPKTNAVSQITITY